MVHTASSEPRVQTVDFIREVRAHLPAPPSPQAQIIRTVGISLRGAAKATQAFGEDGKAAPIGGIHSPNF